MIQRNRSIQERRKAQICQAARDCFLAKGFQATSMEDIVKAVGMSKGGVYHYYQSTIAILHDLMLDGNTQRFVLADDYLAQAKQQDPQALAMELVMQKLFDHNDYKRLYAMFLMECHKHESLQALKRELEAETKAAFMDFIRQHDLPMLAFMVRDDFIEFANAMIIAGEYLPLEETFLHKSDLVRQVIVQAMAQTTPANQKEGL